MTQPNQSTNPQQRPQRDLGLNAPQSPVDASPAQEPAQSWWAGMHRAKRITVVGATITLIVFVIFAFVAMSSFNGFMVALFVGFPVVVILAVATFIAQKMAQP